MNSLDSEFNAYLESQTTNTNLEKDYDYTPLSVITEAYFGKSKLSIEMEKCIASLKSKYDNKFSIATFGAIETSDEWQRLKHLIEKQYGFYSVSLILKRDVFPNAYTYPITMTIDGSLQMAQYARVDKSGLKYDPKYKVCALLYITDSLMFNPDMTPGEIMAVLTHEIGHNFDVVCFKHLSSLTFTTILLDVYYNIANERPFRLISDLTAIKGVRNAWAKWNNLAQSTKCLWIIYDVFSKLAKIPVGIAVKITYPFIKLYSQINGLIVASFPLAGLFITYTTYSSETFADKFAAMHGYGPELASAMGKLEIESNNLGTNWLINRIPIVAHLTMFMTCTLEFFARSGDPHPEYVARMLNIAQIIESDLNDKHIDPKTRKQAKKDLERIKHTCKSFLENTENNSFGDKVYKAYQRFLLSSFPRNGDIRSAILKGDKINDDTINKELKELSKRKNNEYFESYSIDKTMNPKTKSSRVRRSLPKLKGEGKKTTIKTKDSRLKISQDNIKSKIHKGF